MLGCTNLPITGKDKYGQLGLYLHRLAAPQQSAPQAGSGRSPCSLFPRFADQAFLQKHLTDAAKAIKDAHEEAKSATRNPLDNEKALLLAHLKHAWGTQRATVIRDV